MKIAIIGAGNMGGAIATALYGAGGFEGVSIAVSNPTQAKLDALAARCPGITVTRNNFDAIRKADVIVLAVKPWILPQVIAELNPLILHTVTVVSVAGGVNLDDLDSMFEHKRLDRLPPIFQAIPNTAITTGRGMTFFSGRRDKDGRSSEIVGRMFGAMGDVAQVPENLMDAGTALCSCGIAYVFKYMQACVQAGVQMGFRPDDALRYTLATIDGATSLMRRDGLLPQQEIDRVTTPGGMTIRGINSLEHNGFTSAVIRAITAAL